MNCKATGMWIKPNTQCEVKMPKKSLHSYNAIIKHTLSQAVRLNPQFCNGRKREANSIAGFCQLQGPTGGGKSSSLYRKGYEDGVAPALEQIRDAGFQAILVTHRWNILHDIYEHVISHSDKNNKKFQASVLYAQDETVRAAVTRKPLPHEKGLASYDLPESMASIKQLAEHNLLAVKGAQEKLQQKCQDIQRIDRALIKHAKHPVLLKYIEKEKESLRKACASVEYILVRNMAALDKEVEKNRDTHGADSELTGAALTRLQNFRANPWVRRILPAIVWRDEQQHLLIMTTQKMFSSFYDGRQKVRMSSSDLEGYVVFIDEFDYQADVLQQLLSQSQLVHEPPECLGQLLDGGRRLLSRMQHVETEPVPEINRRLKQLLDALEKELKERNIDLSESRALVTPLEQRNQDNSFEAQYLFRSDHLVTSKRLSMYRRPHGYEVRGADADEQVDQADEQCINIGDFLRLMEQYVRRFSLLMTDLSAGQTEDALHEYILKLNRLLFDPANDYRPSYYSATLPHAALYSLPRADLSELSSLLESNVLPNTHANIYGLTNWLLKQNSAEADLDPLRIQIRRAFLPTTPEGLLLSLASRNLVFALSATSFIERANCHFDVRWVTAALRYVAEARDAKIATSFLGTPFTDRPGAWFKKPVPYVQSDEDAELQQEMIAAIKKVKAAKRQTELQVHVHDFDSLQSHGNGDMLESLAPDFFQIEEQGISDYTRTHRQNVLTRLIEVLHIAGMRPGHQGHLVFVNSIRYFRKWLLEDEACQSRAFLPWFEIDSAFSSQDDEHAIFAEFEDVFLPVHIHNTPALICLLTAECQKRSGFSEAYQAAFNTGRTVIVITQTATATNGINLDFSLPESGDKMDLTYLYLLETRHFYFSTAAGENSDKMAHAGHQLRNLEKLLRAGQISRKQHRRYILSIMTGAQPEMDELNGTYKKLDDYTRNTAADIQQQVGRVERSWSAVPLVEIDLTRDIAACLLRFAVLPVYTSNRKRISDLTCQLLDTLLNEKEESNSLFLESFLTPVQDGSTAVQIIDHALIPAIHDVREGKREGAQVARLWKQLGRAILQFDYAWRPGTYACGIDSKLFKWACIEKPEESTSTTQLWYDPATWQFFAEPGDNRVQYLPGRLYEHIQRHPSIVDWFNRMGYRTSISPPANSLEERYVYHPKVVQRLLQGRLGEEAIRALLDDQGITTTDTLQDTRALELYDFRIEQSRYRIDAKFWGRESLDKADEAYQQWLAEGADPDKAPLGLVHKLEQIRELEGDDVQLAVINFVATRDDAPLLGFDTGLKPVAADAADILVLSGCITPDPVPEYTPGFQQFIKIVSS